MVSCIEFFALILSGLVPRSTYVIDVEYLKGYAVEDMLEYAAENFKDKYPRISWALSFTMMEESIGIHFGFINRFLSAYGSENEAVESKFELKIIPFYFVSPK